MLTARSFSRLTRFLIAVAALVGTMPALMHGHAPTAAARGAAKPAAPAGTYRAPRTAWGDPDFQGVWQIGGNPTQAESSLPPEFGELLVKARASRYEPNSPRAQQNARLSTEKPKIVDPANGHFPLLPGKFIIFDPFVRGDHWTNHKITERCITGGMLSMYLEGDIQRIVQSPGWVVMMMENIHDVRAIPTDGRPHLGQDIRFWSGDPRGRWDGDTLVVETTNYNDKGQVYGEIGGNILQSSQMRVSERWTRVDARTIRQEMTVTDPLVFSRPWTAVMMHELQGPEFFIVEYACHEGNGNYMAGSLRQGRIRDQRGEGTANPAARYPN